MAPYRATQTDLDTSYARSAKTGRDSPELLLPNIRSSFRLPLLDDKLSVFQALEQSIRLVVTDPAEVRYLSPFDGTVCVDVLEYHLLLLNRIEADLSDITGFLPSFPINLDAQCIGPAAACVGQTRIHLDEVEGLGSFLELEVFLQEGQQPEEGTAIATALMEKLGVKREDLIAGAYIDLIKKRS